MFQISSKPRLMLPRFSLTAIKSRPRSVANRRWASTLSAPKRSQIFAPTTFEEPNDAQIPSHRLLIQAGLVKKTAAGIYTYLPLGLRVLEKAIKIIDEEMKAVGGQKLSMAKLQPSTLWKKTNRWNTTGPELVRLQDRKGEDFCMAPTAEELVTDIVADVVHSYRQLPVMLYQIGEKYRDEMRPRYGLIRGREFLMKDMYSFDTTQEAAHSTYERVVGAYHRVMQRFRLPYIVAEADSGNIGGNKSHEFHALAAVGEDTLLTCPKCGQYTANVEKARGRVSRPLSLPEERTRHQITSMDQFLALFDHPERAPMQCTVFVLDDKMTEPVLVITPLGETVNEYHVKSAFPNNKMTFQPYDQVRNLVNKAGASALRIVFDNTFKPPTSTGATTASYQWIDNLVKVCQSGAKQVSFGDFRYTKVGDTCPGESIVPGCKGDGILEERKGIEVGHCFYLGTKYSEPMGATFQDPSRVSIPIEMGCYGIGVSRILATSIETSHDKFGIRWPDSIAPYRAIIVPIGDASEASNLMSKAEEIYSAITKSVPSLKDDIVVDDRIGENPGFRMKEAQLIGYPLMLILGKEWKKTGLVDVEDRLTGTKSKMSQQDIVELFKKRDAALEFSVSRKDAGKTQSQVFWVAFEKSDQIQLNSS